ncbi:MAG: alpha/beta fold hydrolase [Gemmatimonadota bacterium]
MQDAAGPGALSTWRPEPFHPAPWARGAHMQTVLGRYLRRPPAPAFLRERVETPDGDFVDLDFPAPPAPGAPLVLLVHGLEGSARRGYAIHVYRALAARGVGAVGLNFRFCSGEPNRTARMYHSGETEDIRHVLQLLAARFHSAPLGAVGFSLGGNALLKYLGEEGAAAPVRVAAAVSVPYDLAAGADALNASWAGRRYAAHFVRSLVRKAEAKAALIQDRCDLARVRAARSFRDFDEHATAPIHGFAGAADYYARSSAAGFLPAIRVPTLLLHARDDPFLPWGAFPAAAVAANPALRAVVTARGGHVGFMAGPPWAPRFWAERQVASWLAAGLTGSA